MKIAALDALQLADLDWSPFNGLGDISVYDATKPDLVSERAAGAQIVLVNKVKMTREVIGSLPELRYIGVLATGYDNIDLQAATERGVTVTNVPGYSTDSVAQLTFALLLELCHHAGEHSRGVTAENRWSSQPYYCYWDYPLVELAGKTMGVFGLGRIGLRVAAIAHALGMKVIACSRTEKDVPSVEMVDFDALLRRSDCLSLNCPLTDATRGLIDMDALCRMKKSAFLVNTSRGGVIVEEDLRRALDEGVIAGAAVDVLSAEPPTRDNPLLGAKNIIITPHIAWATREARERLLRIVYENICAWREGRPVNAVNTIN
ncbi:MAG: D-2-hydroxyacid dehydrogenase [Clostridia bacterium]|nr:D-2-hydroxyacid dehydrogenase [Clostridia bacterium]